MKLSVFMNGLIKGLLLALSVSFPSWGLPGCGVAKTNGGVVAAAGGVGSATPNATGGENGDGTAGQGVGGTAGADNAGGTAGTVMTGGANAGAEMTGGGGGLAGDVGIGGSNNGGVVGTQVVTGLQFNGTIRFLRVRP
jgi:hypothetical protein